MAGSLEGPPTVSMGLLAWASLARLSKWASLARLWNWASFARLWNWASFARLDKLKLIPQIAAVCSCGACFSLPAGRQPGLCRWSHDDPRSLTCA